MDKALSIIIKAAIAAVLVTAAAKTVAPHWERWRRRALLKGRKHRVEVELDAMSASEADERLERLFAKMDKIREEAGLKPFEPVGEN